MPMPDPTSLEMKLLIAEAEVALGAPTPRQKYGFWIPYAWAARVLVEKGYNITESARTILVRAGLEPSRINIDCVRVNFYKIRNKPWPASLAGVGKNVRPKGEVVVPTEVVPAQEPEPPVVAEPEPEVPEEEPAVLPAPEPPAPEPEALPESVSLTEADEYADDDEYTV